MLKEERQRHIVDLLQQDGTVSAADLVARLGVSADTIRRDLDDLASMGVAQRVHGGALPRPPSVPFERRDRDTDRAKAAIAEAAARLARDGQVIVMDSGTTVLAVARRLPPGLRATVITTSIPVAAVLAHHDSVEVRMTGGSVRKDAQALVGVPAVESLRQVRADLCYLGVCSLHPDIGVSVPDADEAHVKRAMLHGAADVVALATAEKLGTAERYVVGDLASLTHLVTAREVPDEALAVYGARGPIIIRA